MKKVILFMAAAIIIIAVLFGIYEYKKYVRDSNESIKTVTNGTITKIKDLSELKSKSDLIAEVTGTDKYKIIDYKGMKARISTVKVNEVFKGSIESGEINIIQIEDLDVMVENNQKLLLFLRKDRENMKENPYAVVGTGQGIYIIDQHGKIKPQSINNENIMKELSGSYDKVKERYRLR